MTSEQLSERLARDRSAQLQRLGFGNEAELVAMQERDRAATEAAETARQEQLTNEQRLQESLTTAETERDAALADANDQRFQNHVSGMCAASGVSNIPYAQFEIARAAEAMPEGEDLDVQAWLNERMDPERTEHANVRSALGVPEAPAPAAAPANTVPVPGVVPPGPPPAGGNAPKGDDVFAMSDAEWRAKQDALGI